MRAKKKSKFDFGDEFLKKNSVHLSWALKSDFGQLSLLSRVSRLKIIVDQKREF
jgi:hypothetical protein